MSLRNLLRKGRFYYDWPQTPECIEDFNALVHDSMIKLASPRTIFVNAQSVLDDLWAPDQDKSRNEESWLKALNFNAIPRPKPPFACMWLEAHLHGPRQQRIGALVNRIEMDEVPGGLNEFLKRPGAADMNLRREIAEDASPATFMNCGVFHDYEGSAVFTGGITYWLDKDGNFLRSFRQCPGLTPDGRADPDQKLKVLMLKFRQGWMLQAFARMNCKNVELRPIDEGKFRPHEPNKIVPASVWREIVITSVPKIRSGGKDIFEKDEREIRAHWIRGHYADYRHGAGLFGNPKLRCLFWIPEYRRGNEDLGQVIPEYTIQ